MKKIILQNTYNLLQSVGCQWRWATCLRAWSGGSEERMRSEAQVPSCARTWNAARLAVVAARKASERTSEQASKQAGRDCPPVSPTLSMPRRAHGLRTHGGEWGSPSRSSRHPLRERRRVSTRRGAIILTSQDGGGHGGPVRAHARQGRQDPRDRRVRATGHHRRVLRSRCQVLPGRIARRHQEVSVPAIENFFVPPALLPSFLCLSLLLLLTFHLSPFLCFHPVCLARISPTSSYARPLSWLEFVLPDRRRKPLAEACHAAVLTFHNVTFDRLFVMCIYRVLLWAYTLSCSCTCVSLSVCAC